MNTLKSDLPKYGIDYSSNVKGHFYLVENEFKPDKTFRIDDGEIIQVWGMDLTPVEKLFIKEVFGLI